MEQQGRLRTTRLTSRTLTIGKVESEPDKPMSSDQSKEKDKLTRKEGKTEGKDVGRVKGA